MSRDASPTRRLEQITTQTVDKTYVLFLNGRRQCCLSAEEESKLSEGIEKAQKESLFPEIDCLEIKRKEPTEKIEDNLEFGPYHEFWDACRVSVHIEIDEPGYLLFKRTQEWEFYFENVWLYLTQKAIRLPHFSDYAALFEKWQRCFGVLQAWNRKEEANAVIQLIRLCARSLITPNVFVTGGILYHMNHPRAIKFVFFLWKYHYQISDDHVE